MKMLLCNNIMLGAVCAENLNREQAYKWQSLRAEKFYGLFDKAAQINVSYILLFGRIFGQERVTESVIDDLFAAVKTEKNIQVLLFLDHVEFRRISYRNDIPENLHIICMDISDLYEDGCMAVRVNKHSVEFRTVKNEQASFTVDCVSMQEKLPVVCVLHSDVIYNNMGMEKKEKQIPSFEPLGFEDNEVGSFGYSVLEWLDDKPVSYEEKQEQMFRFERIEMKLTPADDQKEISSKITRLLPRLERNVFLRLDIRGKSAFAVTLNAEVLKQQLQNKVFYAEVYINALMDIDESAFENDISLRGEFVRLALQDDSLSESERNRLICCGWNVLTGKEMTE